MDRPISMAVATTERRRMPVADDLAVAALMNSGK